jgi:hypothetical protein
MHTSLRIPALLSLVLLAGAGVAIGCGGTTSSSGVDADGDGYAGDADCDESDPTIHAGQDEPCVCDGIACSEEDLDGDGHPVPTDCNDADATIHPGAAEPCACDGIDQNCNGDPHDFPCEMECVDNDMDGYPVGIDCNDNDPTVHPDPNQESCDCDGIDQNCNGIIDDMPCDMVCTYLSAGDICQPGMEPACGAGLACCYPCGIPDCDFVCVNACNEPGCSGGCPPPPP